MEQQPTTGVVKRKFISHILCDKDRVGVKKKKIERQCVEDLVASCYINVIVELVEKASMERCNGCNCSFIEKMELYFTHVMVGLMKDNEEVCKKFENVVELCVGIYDKDDVENARKMLHCSTHREKFCKDKCNSVF